MMRLVWDEQKRVANLKKHGFDFADATLLDWSSAVLDLGKIDQFGRLRYKAIGHFSGGVATIIFAPLGSEAISIISFRPASTDERNTLNE